MDRLWLSFAHTGTGTSLMLRRSGDQSISTVAELVTRSDHPKDIEASVDIDDFSTDSPS